MFEATLVVDTVPEVAGRLAAALALVSRRVPLALFRYMREEHPFAGVRVPPWRLV